MNAFLTEYNNSKNERMDMYLFSSIVDHITRLSRIISQPNGHALLLVGLGGEAYSITKLASFIAEFELHELSVTQNYKLDDWKNQLKKGILHAEQTTSLHDC
jgi:dynein heavy chain